MSGVPQLLIVGFAVAALPWFLVALVTLSRPGRSGYRTLCISVGGGVISACFVTVGGRMAIPASTLTAISLATAVLLATAGFAMLTARRHPGPQPGRGIVIITLLMAVLGWVSLIANGYSLIEYAGPAVSLALLPAFAILTRNSGASREQILKLVFRCAGGVVYVSLILALIARSLAFGDTNQDARRLELGPLTQRLSGVAGHPNFLAFIALILVVLAFTIDVRRRWLHILAGVGTIGLAEARNALLSLAIVLVVLYVLRGRRLLRATLMTPVVTLLLIAGHAWLQDDSSTLLTADVANNGRYRIWDLVLAYFSERPLYGWGPVAFRERSGSPLLQADLAHAHNQVVQALAEGGMIGVVLLAALTYLLAVAAIRHVDLPIYAGLVTILLMSYTTQVFLSPHIWGANIAMVPALLIIPAMLSAGQPDGPLPVPSTQRYHGPLLRQTQPCAGGGIAESCQVVGVLEGRLHDSGRAKIGHA